MTKDDDRPSRAEPPSFGPAVPAADSAADSVADSAADSAAGSAADSAADPAAGSAADSAADPAAGTRGAPPCAAAQRPRTLAALARLILDQRVAALLSRVRALRDREKEPTWAPPRDAEEEEVVHDLRVASRRASEALRTLAPLLPEKTVGRTIKAVRAVRLHLGELRNLEVMDRKVSALMEASTLPEALVLEELQLRLRRRLEAAWTEVHKTVGAGRYAKLERKLEELAATALQAPAPAEGQPLWDGQPDGATSRAEAGAACALDADPRAFAAARLAAARRDAADAEAELEIDPGQAAALHRLRIRLKQLRYRSELFAALEPPSLEAALAAMKKRQELLGELQDLHVLSQELLAQRERLERRGRTLAAALATSLLRRVEDLWKETHHRFQKAQVETKVSELARAMEVEFGASQ